MGKKLLLMALLAAGACAAPAADEEDPAGANRPAAEGEATPGDATTVRLARLPDSEGGDAATTAGTLEAEGSCLYLRTVAGPRYLIASTMPGARWDAEAGALVVPGAGGGTFRPGERVSLGGSEAKAATLTGLWVEPPGERCDTGRVWVTNSVGVGR